MIEEKRRHEGDTRERRERLNALIETFKNLEEREDNISRLINLLETEVQALIKSLNADPDVKDPRVVEKLSCFITSQAVIRSKKKKFEGLDERLLSKIKVKEGMLRKLEREKSRLDELYKRAKAISIANRLREKLLEVLENKRDAVLRILAHRALDILSSITDQKIYHSIIINTQTYSVNVHPWRLAEPIPATRIGGGHQTLIALAIRLSILNFINFRDLIILDEPTYGVDQENLQLLLNYFSSLRGYVKQAIVVTHHGYGLEGADNIITVYRDGDGVSRVKQEF